MKTVVFIIKKDDNSFVNYNITKQPLEQITKTVESFNNKDGNTQRAEIITDPHVIAAILRKDSIDTIESYCNDVKENCDRLRNYLDEQCRSIDNNVESMMEYVKEKMEEINEE